MEIWKTALTEAMRHLSGRPGSGLEQWVLIICTGLIGILVFNGILKTVSDHGQGMLSTMLAGSMGILLTLAGVAASLLYLPADWVRVIGNSWMIVVPAILTGLLVVVPLFSILWRYNYLEVLFSWALALTAAAMIGFLVSVVFDLFYTGSKNADRIHQRNQAMERFIDQR